MEWKMGTNRSNPQKTNDGLQPHSWQERTSSSVWIVEGIIQVVVVSHGQGKRIQRETKPENKTVATTHTHEQRRR